GTSVDITERKRIEEALNQSQEFNRQIIESSNDCMNVLDLDGHLLYMNPTGQTVMEICDMDDYLHASWLDFWKGEDREAAATAIAHAKDGEKGSFRGYCPTAKSTPKWWDVVVTPIKDVHGNVVQLLSISRDITEHKRAEEDLHRLTARLFNLQDEERRRIARELHDQTAQNLFAITANHAKLQEH